jgi:hypothetical protein
MTNNPSKYWTLLNDLSRDNKTTSPDIANITWFNYFQELNNNKLNAPNSNIKKNLERLEEEQMFSELDFYWKKNFAPCATKNKYSNSCVVRKKNSERNKKP